MKQIRKCRTLTLEVFQTPELAFSVGCAAGIATARQTFGVSKGIAEGLRGTLRPLSARLLPKLYVCGGRRDGTTLKTLERFDLTTQVWETLPSMPTAVRMLGCWRQRQPLRSGRAWRRAHVEHCGAF